MHRRLLAPVLLLLTLLAGCGESTPRQAAEGYLAALERLDFEAASRFVAEEGRANFNYLKRLYADLEPEEQKKFQVTDWQVTDETTSGETATVDFVFDGTKRGQLSLQKVRGQWKVDYRQTF